MYCYVCVGAFMWRRLSPAYQRTFWSRPTLATAVCSLHNSDFQRTCHIAPFWRVFVLRSLQPYRHFNFPSGLVELARLVCTPFLALKALVGTCFAWARSGSSTRLNINTSKPDRRPIYSLYDLQLYDLTVGLLDIPLVESFLMPLPLTQLMSSGCSRSSFRP
jgi:hypothetical protein